MKKIITCIAIFCCLAHLHAQQNFFTIDLARIVGQKPDKNNVIRVDENLESDSLNFDGIRLLNTCYGEDYNVTVGSYAVNKVNEPFSLPKSVRPLDTVSFAIKMVHNLTTDEYFGSLRSATLKLFSVRDERDIPEAYDNLRLIVNQIKINNIEPRDHADSMLLDSVQKIVAASPKIDIKVTFRIGKNHTIAIRIVFGTVTIIYNLHTTQEPKHWFIHYGFTYSTEWISPSRQYYSKADTGGTYLVTRMNGRNGNFLDNLSPTLQFSYRLMPNRFMLSPSLVGGFSLNLSNPSALFGFGCLIGDNLSVNIGMMFSQRYFLKGEFTDNQRLDTSKTFDDLHSKHYVPEFYFSIAFRFDENPFKGEKSDQ